MARASLSAASAQQAADKLLERITLIDGHNDLPLTIRRKANGDVRAYDLKRVHQDNDTDIPRMRAGKLTAQFFAAFVPTSASNPGQFTLEQIDIAREIAAAHPDTFLLATKASDVARAKKLGLIALFVTVESGVGLENAIAPLRIWHAAGVRLFTLCHNETLDWVDSATDKRRNGFTKFGEAVVHEANRLGILVDMAHVAPHCMHKVLDTTRAPLVWSHSNAFSLTSHQRNVPDDVLARVAANGGLVMPTFVPAFLNQATRDWFLPVEDGHGKGAVLNAKRDALNAPAPPRGPCPPATLEHYLDHMDYISARVGIDHVGIGSDFYGEPTPQGLEDTSCFPRLIAGLLRRGYSQRDVTKIAGGNMLRVLREVAAIAERLKHEAPRTGRIEDYDR